MRRIDAAAAVLLGLALAVLPGAGYAADQPSSVAAGDDCGAGAGSTTETVLYDGELVTIIADNFGTCLDPVSNSVTSQSPLRATATATAAATTAATAAAPGAAPAVPVPGRPAFTG